MHNHECKVINPYGLCAWQSPNFNTHRLHSVYVERTNELIAGTILDKMPLPVIVMTAPYKSELYNFSLQAMNHNVQW